MGRYDNFIICSDLDGTLLNNKGEFSRENYEAIENFCKNGGAFTLATGRWPSYLSDVAPKEFFKSPIICCNGACIYDFKLQKILYECPLEEKVLEICDFLSKNDLHISANVIFRALEKQTITDFGKNMALIRDMFKKTIYKIVLVMDDSEKTVDLKNLLVKNFGEYFNFSRSWATGLEILNKNTTKGDALKILKEMIDKKRTLICVGDYENDITMIDAADIGCVVENAVPELKSIADKIICSNDEHAIKYIIENICDRA